MAAGISAALLHHLPHQRGPQQGLDSTCNNLAQSLGHMVAALAPLAWPGVTQLLLLAPASVPVAAAVL